MDAEALAELVEKKDYAALEERLAGLSTAKLARAWPPLSAMQRLVCFKLLDAGRALELYEALPFREKYELLCGFPLQAIAPVLEPLSLVERRRFVTLPREFYERMFRLLVAEQAAPR